MVKRQQPFSAGLILYVIDIGTIVFRHQLTSSLSSLSLISSINLFTFCMQHFKIASLKVSFFCKQKLRVCSKVKIIATESHLA